MLGATGVRSTAAVVALAATHAVAAEAGPAPVHATAETEPVHSTGDAADDPAVWRHATDPSESLVLGTDKQAGLGVYRLDGSLVRFLDVGRLNNVDVRHGFNLGGRTVDIAAGTLVADNALAVWSIEPESGAMRRIDGGGITSSLPDVYGFCLHMNAGELFAITSSKAGLVEVIHLENSGGGVNGAVTSVVPVGTKLEGLVADDETGVLYVGEEEVGIWRYELPEDPADWDEFGHARRIIDHCADTQGEGNLTSDVEGLAIWHGSAGQKAGGQPEPGGYLIASSQGSDRFCVYGRGSNTYLGSFTVTPTGTIDGVTHTDGIAVFAGDLGPAFPFGVAVVQDDDNDGATQNFKIIPWEHVAEPLGLDVLTDHRVRAE